MANDLNEQVDFLLLKKSKAAFDQHAEALENAKKLARISSIEENKSTDKGSIPRVVIRHKAKGTK